MNTEKLVKSVNTHTQNIIDINSSLETMEKKTDDTLYIDFFKCDDGKYVQGDGIHDDTTGIQRALNFAIKNRYRCISSLKDRYYVTNKIILPFANIDFPLDVNFNGATFIGNDNNTLTLFECGRLLNEEAVTVWDSKPEQYLTQNVLFHNFKCENICIILKIRNWVYGCKVSEMWGYNCRTMIHSQRCFYTIFENILPRVSNDYIPNDTPLYIFEDNNNIMPLKSLRICKSKIGYRFIGAVESLRMVDCGIEGAEIGIDIVSVCYNLKIDSCYFESSNIAINVNGAVRSLVIDNCWFYNSSGVDKFIFKLDSSGALENLDFRPSNIINGYKFFETRPSKVCNGVINIKNDYIADGNVVKFKTFIDENNIPKGIFTKKITSNYRGSSGLSGTFAISEISTLQCGVQSGQYHQGYSQIIPLCNYSTSGNDAIIKTSILYSDTQLVYINFKIATTVRNNFIVGFIQGKNFFEFGNATVSTKITVSVDTDGYMIVTIPSLSSDGIMNLAGGQIMLLG